MRKIISLATVVVLGMMLTACGSSGGIGGYGPKTIGGAIVGAGLGGFGGSQICDGDCGKITTVLGVLGGGLVGGAIGDSLDNMDRMAAQQAEQAALNSAPVGQNISWQGQNSGNSGYTQIDNRGVNTQTGANCAQYTSRIYVNGQEQTAQGVACQMPNGNWQVQS